MRSRRSTFLLAVLFLVGVAGCASYKYGKIDVQKPDGYPNHVTRSGISLAADLYDSVEKVKTGFYVDVNSKGYYPIHVILANESNERIMIGRENIALLDRNGTPCSKVRSNVMSDDCEHNKMAYALLGFGIFSYMSADDANKKMAADWRDKEMAEQVILHPGKRMNGFLYFRIPNEKNGDSYTLRAEVEKIDSKETVPLEIALGPIGGKAGSAVEAAEKKTESPDPLRPNN